MSLPDYFRRSVRRRITWTFGLFVALSMVTVATAVGFRLFSTITANLTYELEQRARQDAALFMQRIEYLLESASVLVKNPLVINGLSDAQGRLTYLPGLVKNFSEGRDVRTVALLGFDGKPVYSSMESLPTYGDSVELRSTLANDIVSYLVDTARGYWVVFVPVSYYNSTQGALVVAFDLAAVAKRVLPSDGLIGHRLRLADQVDLRAPAHPRQRHPHGTPAARHRQRKFSGRAQARARCNGATPALPAAGHHSGARRRNPRLDVNPGRDRDFLLDWLHRVLAHPATAPACRCGGRQPGEAVRAARHRR